MDVSPTFVVMSVIAGSYALLAAVLSSLGHQATFIERKKDEKRFDALGREY